MIFEHEGGRFKVVFAYTGSATYIRLFRDVGGKWELEAWEKAECSASDRFEKAVGRGVAYLRLLSNCRSREFAKAFGAALRGVRMRFPRGGGK